MTRVRPLVAGVSIGNWAITAGTLGWFFRDGRGREMLGSNAHVFAEDALKTSSSEKRVVQPGRYDQGNVPDDIVGRYHWHQSLGGSECALSNAIAGILNGASARARPVRNLRDAVLSMIEDARTGKVPYNLYHWAPFQIYGI